MPLTALITGGSGYLGQFLVEEFARTDRVGFTHHSSIAPSFGGDVRDFWVDFATGSGLQEVFDKMGAVDVVINTAAISSPAACEKNPAAARAVNVPSKLLACLEVQQSVHGRRPLLIQISTDQVYDGSRAWWAEDDDCNPLNAYGKSKREAEVVIQDRWPEHVILRSSIIYGPQCAAPVSRTLFLQFIESSLAAGKPTSFFSDEYRCPVYVKDIITTVRAVISRRASLQHRVFNMGGPERLSRLDMARKVAEAHGYSQQAIVAVPSASVDRGVASPADISMVVTRLSSDLDIDLTPFSEALKEMGSVMGQEQATC